MRWRRWPTTRPPVSIPLEATIMYGRGARSIACGILDVVRDDLLRVVERRVAGLEQLAGLVVVVLRVASVDVGRLRGHRRVEVERQERDLATLDEPIQLPDDFLGPPDRERRDEEHALGLVDHADGLGEDPDGLVLRLVFAATVRATRPGCSPRPSSRSGHAGSASPVDPGRRSTRRSAPPRPRPPGRAAG